MNKYLKYITPLVFLLSLTSIFMVKSIPTSKIWKEYTVLYVPAQTNEAEVLQVLDSADIKDVVALSRQYLPVSLPEKSVEISMFKINRENPAFSYYINRNSYFFDKTNSYKLFYIPVNYKSKIYDAVSLLNAKGISSGIDSASSYPWIISLIALVLVIMLCLFSKNKVLFFISALIPVIYLVSNPFYPLALANILVIITVFFISNVWRRKGWFTYLLNKYSVPAMLAIAVFCSFTISIKSGFMFLVQLISIGSFIYSYSEIESLIRNRKSFSPVYIKSAHMVSIYARKTNIVLPVTIAVGLILTGVFFLSSNQNTGTHFSKILLPSPVSSKTEELPQFEDFYRWIWNIKTYPYRSLNTAQEDHIVEYPRYKNENGIITESRTIMAYNQNFKNNTFDEIDDLQFDAIEKVIKSEGQDSNFGYAASKSYSTNLLSIIMMILCLFVLLFMYFSTIIRKDSKR